MIRSLRDSEGVGRLLNMLSWASTLLAFEAGIQGTHWPYKCRSCVHGAAEASKRGEGVRGGHPQHLAGTGMATFQMEVHTFLIQSQPHPCLR